MAPAMLLQSRTAHDTDMHDLSASIMCTYTVQPMMHFCFCGVSKLLFLVVLMVITFEVLNLFCLLDQLLQFLPFKQNFTLSCYPAVKVNK